MLLSWPIFISSVVYFLVLSVSLKYTSVIDIPQCEWNTIQLQQYHIFLSTESCLVPSSPAAQEEDSVQFNKLSYLGCTWVKAPRNEAEAQTAMATLRAASAIPIPITLHVPCGPDGSVRSATQTGQIVCMSERKREEFSPGPNKMTCLRRIVVELIW